MHLIDQVAVQNELGEGVIWDHVRQRIWWVDIDQSKLFRYDPTSKQLETWTTPERLSCFAPVQGQDYLVAAFESGFAYYEPDTGWLEWLVKIEQDNPGTRMNDGRTDRQGRFWAGSMVEDSDQASDKGRLYCLNHDLSVSEHINGLSITNSLCWSPDSKLLYHCDTPLQRIDQYDFDSQQGTLGAKQTFSTTAQNCYPDGSTVDAQGYLWNAQWGGSQVVRYAPDGATDLVLDMPVSQPSCVAFGGEKLDLLIVTTAHEDLSEQARAEQPSAGDLFIYQTEFKGIAESPFIPS